MVPSLFNLLLAPAIVTATAIEYYRSALCDIPSSGFFLDRYTIAEPLLDDKTCHQTPARTTAVRLVDGLDPACIVLAYDDYGCTSLVGSLPTNGKCVAATKAKIGSWGVRCGASAHVSSASWSAIYAPGDLKRRGKQRLPSIRDVYATTIHPSVSRTVTLTLIASPVASDVSSPVNASASSDPAASITPSPSAGATLSTSVSSGSGIEYNLTSSVIAAANSSYVMSTLKTVRPSSTVTGSSNGTALLHVGGSPSNQPDARRIMVTALCGVLAFLVAVVV